MDLLDLPAYFDPIERILGAAATFANADWQRAYARAGLLGIAAEFLACVTNENAPTFYFSRHSGWSGSDVENVLRRHGIQVWDRGMLNDELFFCVKRRQARWAEYVLLRAGVPLTHAPIDPRNRETAARYPTSVQPHDKRRVRRKRA